MKYITVAILLLVILLSGCGTAADPLPPTVAESYTATDYVAAPEFILDGENIYHGAYGEIWISASAPTIIGVADTFYKVAGTTTEEELRDFETRDNRLTYVGSVERQFLINASFSCNSDTNNVITTWVLYVNGAPHDSGTIRRKIATAGDIGAMSLTNLYSLKKNEYVELWLACDTTCEITVGYMTMTIAAVD